jgi:hypothetical protein
MRSLGLRIRQIGVDLGVLIQYTHSKLLQDASSVKAGLKAVGLEQHRRPIFLT